MLSARAQDALFALSTFVGLKKELAGLGGHHRIARALFVSSGQNSLLNAYFFNLMRNRAATYIYLKEHGEYHLCNGVLPEICLMFSFS